MMNMPKPFARKHNQMPANSPKSRQSGDHSYSAIHNQGCMNTDKWFQFQASRQRALAQPAPTVGQNPVFEYIPHRIFINQIDTFNGSHLAKCLSEVVREGEEEGEEGEEGDEEGDGEFEESRKDSNSEYDVEGDGYEKEGFKEKFSSSYEIMGTLEFNNNPEYSRPEGILELLNQEKTSEFLEKVLTCGYIIYDITSDLHCHPNQVKEAKWVIESIANCLETMEKESPKMFLKYKPCRTFILISTLMTWAKTKPIDPEDPTLPFTEKDFRKRKPHPNYRVHCELEKKVIELGKKYPQNLRTIVIGSGIPYGHEEDVLHFLFKMAWLGTPHLPIFKPGTNIIPVIHIDSLSSIVHMVIEAFPLKYKYLIATDPHSVTLKEITKLLAKQLGNGKTLPVSQEEAFLYPDIKQKNYDMLTSNMNIVPGYLMDNPLVKWGTDAPLAENMPKIISEYTTARGLSPIKIFIHGPPASGKTFLAKRLANYYDVPHLHVKGVIEETIQNLKDKIQAMEEKNARREEMAKEEKIEIEGDEPDDTEEEEEDDEEEDLEALKNSLKEIEDNMDNERRRLDEAFVIRFFKEKMLSNLCKNKGFVIDGYPKTLEDTKTLYAPDGDEAQEEEAAEGEEGVQGDVTHLYNVKIMPAYVQSLDASDEFLINRVINLPEITVSHYEEHQMCRRLTEFRSVNTEENTPLIFYDELDVHPMIYRVEEDKHPQMGPTFEAIISHIGLPKNYGKEGMELEEFLEAEALLQTEKEVEDLKTQREEFKKVVEEKREKMEKWMFQKSQELEMEEKAFLVAGMPLRHYLMKYIFPCLTRGLVEVARVRPDDPVDFLSEFLFRENPEGKMFQPDYEERDQKLGQAINEYENMLAERQAEKKAKSSSKSFSTEKSARSGAVSGVTDWKCSLASKSGASQSRRSYTSTKSGKSTKSSSTGGVCTCQKSPSLSTCSSDRVSSTSPVSCTCSIPSPCEPCDPCDTPEEKEDVDPCKCPC